MSTGTDAAPDQERIAPLGAPTDPLRPTGRVSPSTLSPPPPQVPMDPRRWERTWVGATLAIGGLAGWFVAFALANAVLEEGAGSDWERSYETLLPWSLLVAAGYVVGVSAYAWRTRAAGLLAGFWGALLLVAAVVVFLWKVVFPNSIFGVE